MDVAVAGRVLEEARASWERIVVPRRTPMQQWIWIEACFDSYYRDSEPYLVFAETAGGRAGAAFARRGRLVKRLFLAGADESGAVEPAYTDASAAAALAEKVCASRLAVRFGHFPADSSFLEGMRRHSKGKGWLLTRRLKGSPYIELDESWREPLSKYSSHRRSVLRQQMRKAEKLGAVEFEIIAPTGSDVDALLDEMIAVEAKSWKMRAGTALACDVEQAAFIRSFARLASEHGLFRIGRMRIGGKTAAMLLAIECDGSFWGFKSGYDEAFSRCSPGVLLIIESIRQAAQNGLSTYEFLGKADGWKKMWTQTDRPLTALRYYPFSVWGFLALTVDSAQLAWGNAANSVRTALTKPKRRG